MNWRQLVHRIRSKWSPAYADRMTATRWMARLAKAETAWRAQFAKLAKETELEKKRAAEVIRRVSNIQYSRPGDRGEVCIQIMVPAMELCANDGGRFDDAFFRHTAGYVGHMLEREFAQLNATTLAQAIHASERRQYEMDRGHRIGNFFGATP